MVDYVVFQNQPTFKTRHAQHTHFIGIDLWKKKKGITKIYRTIKTKRKTHAQTLKTNKI